MLAVKKAMEEIPQMAASGEYLFVPFVIEISQINLR
jgi:hypothetical protein